MTERFEGSRAEPPECLVESRLLSRDKAVFTSSPQREPSAVRFRPGRAALAPFRAEAPLPEPAWLALPVGVGPRRVLINWAAPRSGAAGGAAAPSPSPSRYQIQTSSDSTNGLDGAWRTELAIDDNTLWARQHDIEFDGQSWIRIWIERAPPGAASVQLDRFDVHDASDGCDDTWLFIGTERAEDEALPAEHGSTFAELVHESYPGYFPAVLGAGDFAPSPAQLSRWLEHNPTLRHVVIVDGGAESVAGWLEEIERAKRVAVLAKPDARAVQCSQSGHVRLAARFPRVSSVAERQRYWANSLDFLYAPV